MAWICTHTHTHTQTHFSLNAYAEKPEPINWEFYERNISVPNLVKECKMQFEAVSVPYPKDTASAAITQQQKEFVSEILIPTLLPTLESQVVGWSNYHDEIIPQVVGWSNYSTLHDEIMWVCFTSNPIS